MGLSEDVIGILSKTLWGWGREGIQEDYIREAGLDPARTQSARHADPWPGS